jgi:hypothetical protein
MAMAGAKLRRSHVWAVAVSLLAGATAAVTGLGEWHKVAVDLGLLKSDAFVLAERSAHGELLRQMVHLISERWFWTERFLRNYKAKFPREVQEETWKKYQDSVIAWNENFLLIRLLTGGYFGAEPECNLAILHSEFQRIHNCIVKIRYQSVVERDLECEMPDDIKANFNKSHSGKFESTLNGLR